MTFYDNFKDACKRKGTTITKALKGIGRSTSCTGAWAKGQYPGLDICMELADYLGISIDELARGIPAGSYGSGQLSESEIEWLSIIARIPLDRQEMCKDFLRTHATIPEKYTDKMNA